MRQVVQVSCLCFVAFTVDALVPSQHPKTRLVSAFFVFDSSRRPDHCTGPATTRGVFREQIKHKTIRSSIYELYQRSDGFSVLLGDGEPVGERETINLPAKSSPRSIFSPV